jgi:hypothetical protein
MDGMAGGEPRTYRNWPMIVGGGLGVVSLPLIAFFADPVLRYFWLLFAVVAVVVFLVNLRQYVTIHPTEVEVRKIVQRHRVSLDQVDRLSVICSRIPFRNGWRIRLHSGLGYVDTCSFNDLVEVRLFGGTYAEPPDDTPADVREMYNLMLIRRNAIVRARSAGLEPPAGWRDLNWRRP